MANVQCNAPSSLDNCNISTFTSTMFRLENIYLNPRISLSLNQSGFMIENPVVVFKIYLCMTWKSAAFGRAFPSARQASENAERKIHLLQVSRWRIFGVEAAAAGQKDDCILWLGCRPVQIFVAQIYIFVSQIWLSNPTHFICLPWFWRSDNPMWSIAHIFQRCLRCGPGLDV